MTMKPTLDCFLLRSPYICSSCAKSITRKTRKFATATKASPEIYDIVCVGGGPAGLSLLTALRASQKTSDLRLALIESQDLTPSRTWQLPMTRFSNRASSLTPASKAFLTAIGAWKHIQHSRVQPYHQMQVWDGISGSRIEFDWPSTTQRSPADKTIAHTIENSNIVRALLSRLEEFANVELHDGVKVSSIGLGANDPSSLNLTSWPHLTLSNGRTLAARLLVGADGFNSPVREFAGIGSRGWDYNRQGVVATVKLEGSGWGGEEEKIAYQRFLPTGPIALLALPGQYATLVWSTLPQQAAHLKTLSPTDFAAMVNAAFRLSAVDLAYMHTIPSGQVDELAWREQHTKFSREKIPQRVVSVQEGSIASFPLRMRHADTYIGERVALVGDAAHTIHPLAGQGLNQGQEDVQALVRTIEDAVQHGMDIGVQMSLEAYNAERYSANNRLLGVVDKLHKLYSGRGVAVVGLRSWGLEAVNRIGPLKEFFMRQAAGGGV